VRHLGHVTRRSEGAAGRCRTWADPATEREGRGDFHRLKHTAWQQQWTYPQQLQQGAPADRPHTAADRGVPHWPKNAPSNNTQVAAAPPAAAATHTTLVSSSTLLPACGDLPPREVVSVTPSISDDMHNTAAAATQVLVKGDERLSETIVTHLESLGADLLVCGSHHLCMTGGCRQGSLRHQQPPPMSQAAQPAAAL
jgi:hypothetical protein